MYDGVHTVKLASPRDRHSIRRDVYLLRSKLGLRDILFFNIVEFLECVLPQADPSFYLEVCDDTALPGIQAEFIPASNCICVKQSVYEAAVNGHWWARSTLAHELGHYYYHDESTVRYARLDPSCKVPPDLDPERQANIFAAELLAPIHLIRGMEVREIGRRCGVSYQMAQRQLQALAKIDAHHEVKRKKRKKRSSVNT